MALGIGDTLRAARRQQRGSLSDAAAETRVRESYLAALEEEQWGALGGDVYVKGFLRSYAKYLGLDPDPLVDTYRAEFERPEDPAPIAPATSSALPGPRRSPPQGLVWAGGVALLLVVFIVIGSLGGDGGDTQLTDQAGPSPIPITPATTPAPAAAGVDPDEPAVTSSEDASEAASEPFEELDVQVILDGESWLQVTIDGEVEAEGLQEDDLSYVADEQIEMIVGDAGVVRVEVNGEDQGSLGGAGDVVEVACAVGQSGCEVTET